MKKNISDYTYFSDYYFFEHEIGSTVKYFTDLIKKSGIELYAGITLADKIGYNANIMEIKVKLKPLFKITWDLNVNKTYDIKDVKEILDFFCTVGWETEYTHYIRFYHHKQSTDLSSQYHDIDYYTKPWVDYISVQNSRIILQFDFEKYKKTELRKLKLKRILKNDE